MTSIAVIGPGAIGAAVAAHLIAAGHDVVVCARTPFRELCLETSDTVQISQPRMLLKPQVGSTFDWIIVCVKTYDSATTTPWLDHLSGRTTRIAVIQNGVEHLDRFPAARDRMVPVVIDMPSRIITPGHVIQQRSGRMIVPAGANGEAFARLFYDSQITVTLTDDWKTEAWYKLCINCAGAANALLLAPAGIIADPEVEELMRDLSGECRAVGLAEGAILGDDVIERVVEVYRSGDPQAVNSICADRLAGRQTEADARNGVVYRLGLNHGIKAPLNRMADIILRKTRTSATPFPL